MASATTPPTFARQQFLDSLFFHLIFSLSLVHCFLLFPFDFSHGPDGQISSCKSDSSGSYTCVIWGLCKLTWQVNLTSYNLSSDLNRGKRTRRKSTCQVNLSSWLVSQVGLVTASGTCHRKWDLSPTKKKLPASAGNSFFQNRYRVGEDVCKIFRSFFCVL